MTQMLGVATCLLLLLCPGAATAMPTDADPSPQVVLHRLECAMRELAFNWSQSLLPDSVGEQDAAVASALRLEADCNVDAHIRRDRAPVSATVEGPLGNDAACWLHVATTGSDSTGTGSPTAPFASLHRAQAALATTRSSTDQWCTVYVHAGVYYLGMTLELGPMESNTEWIAAPGVILSGGVNVPWTSFKPSTEDPRILEADVSSRNITTITPRGATGGPANRLFVDGAPMTWARYPDAPHGVPECGLKIPLGRVGLEQPPRVGFMPGGLTPEWKPAVVANYSWIIPTVGPHPDAYYPEAKQLITHFPNWSTPEYNGGAARPGWADASLMDHSGMTPCHWDAVGGPFSRFTPPVGHGAPRTRTVTVAPVGVALAEGSNFSGRIGKWTEVEWGAVQSMHWWHNVKCDGPVDGPNATGTVDCTSVRSGNWPGGYGKKSYGGPGPGDGYWGSWAWQIKSVDGTRRRINFGSGGSQTTRGALNAGPWYVEGIKEELTQPGEWVHSLADQKIYLWPNNTDTSGEHQQQQQVVAASLEQIIAVRGNQSHPVRNVRIQGFHLRHSASHYTGPYPTCGGGDFCAARTGTVVLTGAENVSFSGLDLDHPGGNGIAIIDYARDVEVSGCSLRFVGEVGFVVQGQTDGIDATEGNYPIGTRIHHNFVYEVATKMRGGCWFFQSQSHSTELDHNVALNGPRAGVNCESSLPLLLSFAVQGEWVCVLVTLQLRNSALIVNDGMGGGNNVHHNLIGNFVRESADHGNENSWDRVPFLVASADGSKSLVPAWNRNHHNFWLLPNFGSNIDHDDGSAYYNDSYNVLLGGGGWGKHSGPFQMANGNMWISTTAEHDSDCASGIAQDIQPFKSNVCIGQWSNIRESTDAEATFTGNNTFYTMPPHANVTINGQPLAAAQAKGLERGTSAYPLSSLGTQGVVEMAHRLLTL